MPDTAVRAVTTDQPRRLQRLFKPAGISDNCTHSIRRLGEADEFLFPVHTNPETRQVLDQDPLSLTLRQADSKMITARQTAKPDISNLTTAIVECDTAQLVTGADHRIDDPHHLKHFKRPRKNRQRPGSHRWSRRFIDNPATDAIASQLTRHRKPDRTRTDYKNIYKHTSFLTAMSSSILKACDFCGLALDRLIQCFLCRRDCSSLRLSCTCFSRSLRSIRVLRLASGHVRNSSSKRFISRSCSTSSGRCPEF